MQIQVPEWVKHAVFYQIFPDRFARSERIQHTPGLKFKPWGTAPSEQGYQGGDLLGIVDKLDYLQNLGINAIYLNPIFSSASNHRYHTFDYFQVDPLLGGNDALRELLDEAHKRDMRIILDGVFNHASRGFWQFHHILENGKNSPYIDWFTIQDWPLRPYSSSKDSPPNYSAWWGLPALPKLNTANPDVQAYIFDIAKYWLEFGIDGWRLDVPGEIDDDDFWQKFRQVVKSTNQEAYICGEIWDNASRWLQGDQFDSVMNYIFTSNTLSFFGREGLKTQYGKSSLQFAHMDAREFSLAISKMLELYDWEINLVQLNLLGSHDMARPLWILGNDVEAFKMAMLFQMTMPGTPCIYYGDEIGMCAGDDPDCREAFPWQDASQWNQPLRNFIQEIVELRAQHPALRTGEISIEYAAKKSFAFSRKNAEEKILVVFNNDEKAHTVSLRPGNQSYRPIFGLNSDAHNIENNSIQLTGYSAAVFAGA